MVLRMVQNKSAIGDKLLNFIANSEDAFAIFNADDQLVFCNHKFANLFNSTVEETEGLSFEELAAKSFHENYGLKIDVDNLDDWLAHTRTVRRTQTFRSFEMVMTDDRWFLFSEQLNEDGELLLQARDISSQKLRADRVQQSNDRLRHLSMVDEVTKIPNRRHFIEAAEAELNRCWRSGNQAALLLLTFDSYPLINKSQGHEASKVALRHLASLIRDTLREYDIFGRLNTQEFAVFLGDSDAELISKITERIKSLIANTPLLWNDHAIPIEISVGVSLRPCDTPMEQLLKEAGNALATAQKKGCNRVEMYTKAAS